MNVAILYICTGKYSVFWKEFYESCERYFLPGMAKTYFVFSDTLDRESVSSNVSLIYQQKLGWPYDTLMRFHLFSSIENELREYDYIFFCNANTNFLKTVSVDILRSNDKDTDLVFVKHPFFYSATDPDHLPYERKRKSKAYIPKGKGSHYVLGGFNGGKREAYLELIETLKRNIDKDNKKGVIAIWHDESHLNKYLLDTVRNCKILNYNYGFPEGHDLPLKNDIYIQFLDKAKFGGHDFLREKENSIPVSRPLARSRIAALRQAMKTIFPFS